MKNVYLNELLGYTSTEYESFEDLFSAANELKIKMHQNFYASSCVLLQKTYHFCEDHLFKSNCIATRNV